MLAVCPQVPFAAAAETATLPADDYWLNSGSCRRDLGRASSIWLEVLAEALRQILCLRVVAT
jgi:hypothetical protein